MGETKERKRLTATEREALMRLMIATEILDEDGLARRVKDIKNGPQSWGQARAATERLFKEILNTVPMEQLVSLQRNVKMATYTIGVRKPGARTNDNDYGMWMSWSLLHQLFDAACDHCLTCTKGRQEQRSCPLAKALDEIPSDKTGNEAGCGYFGLM